MLRGHCQSSRKGPLECVQTHRRPLAQISIESQCEAGWENGGLGEGQNRNRGETALRSHSNPGCTRAASSRPALMFQKAECLVSLACFSAEDLELLLDRVNDWIEFRIDAVLEEMSSTPLCHLPQEEPVTCEEFLQMTKVIGTFPFLLNFSVFDLLFYRGQCLKYRLHLFFLCLRLVCDGWDSDVEASEII